jgi:hypothetical protein
VALSDAAVLGALVAMRRPNVEAPRGRVNGGTGASL